MTVLGKKLAVANFNSGVYKIIADLCNPPTEESTEVRIICPKHNIESFFYELENIGLEPKDIVIWPEETDPHSPSVKSISDIGYGKSEFRSDKIDTISLTKTGVQKMLSAGVKHPVIEAMAEHYHMKRPAQSHLDKAK